MDSKGNCLRKALERRLLTRAQKPADSVEGGSGNDGAANGLEHLLRIVRLQNPNISGRSCRFAYESSWGDEGRFEARAVGLLVGK